MRTIPRRMERLTESSDPGEFISFFYLSLSVLRSIIILEMFSNKEEEDEMAAARDIAEFERNKHLSRPCTTLDGFNVSKIFYAWK